MKKLKHRLSNMFKVRQLGSRRIHKKLIEMIHKRKEVRVQCRRWGGQGQEKEISVYALCLSVCLSVYLTAYLDT